MVELPKDYLFNGLWTPRVFHHVVHSLLREAPVFIGDSRYIRSFL